MKIGLNLYGTAKWLGNNFDSDLERLKQIGFTSIEVDILFLPSIPNAMEEVRKRIGSLSSALWFESESDDKMKLIKSRGFEVISAHLMMGVDALVASLPAIKNFGAIHDIKYFVISCSQSSPEEIEQLIPTLSKVATELKKEGRYLVYHNHEMECMPVNGTTSLDCIMEKCPDLMLEIDTGWVQFAGASPVELMKKYRDRLVLLHLKDIRPDSSLETRETCFTAIGEGSIPLKEILAEAKNCNLAENGIIIDQDNSPGNIYDDYVIGIKNIKENF